VAAALGVAYPVGSIYINASVSTNPATLLGFGTWTAFGAGRVLVGLNASDTAFDTLEEVGGSKDAIVVSHTHSVTDAGHSHSLQKLGSAQAGSDNGGAPISASTGYSTTRDLSPTNSASTGISIQSTGSSGTNANLQPYIVVYMWKRVS
jgi:hypothetical protein